MIKDLIILANNLDSKGLKKEANLIDKVIKEAGDLIDLDSIRRDKGLLESRTKEIEEENKLKTQDKLIFVLDDRERWATDAFVAKVSAEDLIRLAEGESVGDVVSINKLISLGDLFRPEV
jgi:hypothetical protein